MDTFTKKNYLERKKMSIEELIKYYCELRKYNFQNGEELKGIEFRKKIHFLIDIILQLDQFFSKEKIVIINDLHTKDTISPKIYACTHIGGNDIQRTLQVIQTPAYLMLGDPGILYKMLIYQGLKMNGVIPLETADKEDRKIAYNRAIELLNKGGNLLIYPEGAWNVSPNLMVMKIFNGTVRMAKETNAEIIPIGVEQYGKTFYFNIGKNYKIDKDDKRSVNELRDDLREKLATLKWEIMNSQPLLKRELLKDNYLKEFQDEIIARCNYGYGFSLEDALRESFHDKNIVDLDDVYSFLENITIDNKKAFLARDKVKFMKMKTLK